MAKILLATLGSLGDLHPFIAIGLSLRRMGHSPVVVTNDIHRERVEATGLGFHAMRPSLADLRSHTGLDMGELVLRASRDPWYLLEDVFLPFTPKIYEDVVAASQGASLIVAHNWAFGAIIAAEAKGIPLSRVALSPLFLQSAIRPSVTAGVPYLVHARSSASLAYNRMLRELARRRIQKKMAPAHAFRKRLGLPESNADYVFDFGRGDFAQSVLAIYSPQLASLQRDHPSHAFVSGFPHFDGGEQVALPAGLTDFLDQGPPPVVLTLGSFVVSGCADFYRNGLAACRRLGMRSVLITGEDEAAKVAELAGPDTFICAYAPHSKVFPRASVVVHHGGIGTTGQAMRSGKPQLVVPSLGDQADNAQRLVERGIARRLPASHWYQSHGSSIGRMAQEIRYLVSDQSYARTAAAVADAVADEDGASAAARHLDRLTRKTTAEAA